MFKRYLALMSLLLIGFGSLSIEAVHGGGHGGGHGGHGGGHGGHGGGSGHWHGGHGGWGRGGWGYGRGYGYWGPSVGFSIGVGSGYRSARYSFWEINNNTDAPISVSTNRETVTIQPGETRQVERGGSYSFSVSSAQGYGRTFSSRSRYVTISDDGGRLFADVAN